MFRIRVRITEDVDELKNITSNLFDEEYDNISGFIEITVGEHKSGCYFHQEPLQEGEIGGELLNWWILLFLECANRIRETKYFAFHEPETVDKWLEFSLKDEIVVINVALDTKLVHKCTMIDRFCGNFTYIEPIDFRINLKDFLDEINSSTKCFLEELKLINPELLKTKMSKKLEILYS